MQDQVDEQDRASQPPAPPPGAPQPGATQPGATQPGTAKPRARWDWQRRVRADPKKYLVYRWVVAVIGVLIVVAGLLTGPIPGPGGIPLVLLGLAVLASEFVWARRLLDRVKREVKAFSEWTARQPRWVRWAGSVGLIVLGIAGIYLALTVFGPPSILPSSVSTFLVDLPGVER